MWESKILMDTYRIGKLIQSVMLFQDNELGTKSSYLRINYDSADVHLWMWYEFAPYGWLAVNSDRQKELENEYQNLVSPKPLNVIPIKRGKDTT